MRAVKVSPDDCHIHIGIGVDAAKHAPQIIAQVPPRATAIRRELAAIRSTFSSSFLDLPGPLLECGPHRRTLGRPVDRRTLADASRPPARPRGAQTRRAATRVRHDQRLAVERHTEVRVPLHAEPLTEQRERHSVERPSDFDVAIGVDRALAAGEVRTSICSSYGRGPDQKFTASVGDHPSCLAMPFPSTLGQPSDCTAILPACAPGDDRAQRRSLPIDAAAVR